MKRGLLIYNREDYGKNSWFANEFIKYASLYDMYIELVFTDEISLEIQNSSLSVDISGKEADKPTFAINRSRDSIIGKHFELMGCRVFNSSLVTEICNNKAKTHQIVNSKGIKSVKTLLCNKKYFKTNNVNLSYPIIIKSVDGHGGSEVYKLDNLEQLNKKVSELKREEFILQELCSNPGKDIRVFVLGSEIIAAVKRYSDESFKANFSLGGQSEKYNLNSVEEEVVRRIISILDFDFVGIDFILDNENRFLFNEIEDVVGTRTLYKHYDIDIVKMYLEHIQKNI
ncbi:ATP-grasp domain-containing protein [Clostridium thermarum]|uniref:ATP-grasp domain-containing protein n=1 Tax=Clostridium thermarum TaxID=1716543 RepID=UPI0013CF5D3F|nr:ATP-grasp domain-containing protein [Clostridium thermarum]